jgi:hypothetical protein
MKTPNTARRCRADHAGDDGQSKRIPAGESEQVTFFRQAFFLRCLSTVVTIFGCKTVQNKNKLNRLGTLYPCGFAVIRYAVQNHEKRPFLVMSRLL